MEGRERRAEIERESGREGGRLGRRIHFPAGPRVWGSVCSLPPVADGKHARPGLRTVKQNKHTN